MTRLVIVFFISILLTVSGCSQSKTDDNTQQPSNHNGEEVSGGAITIDHIDGLYAPPDSITAGQIVTFYMRFTNNSGSPITGATNGFKIWSPDGAQWDTVVCDTTGALNKEQFDGGIFINSFSVTGSGEDTVAFGGFSLQSNIPDGFDEVAFIIQVGPIDRSYHGKQICIDSSFYPPGGAWLWSYQGSRIIPTWDGPKCYRIVEPAIRKKE